MNISNDDFIRTTEPRHMAACRRCGASCSERGEIYLGKYAGWYSVRDEAFYGEDELTTARTAASGAHRRAGRMGRGAQLFLPPVGLAGPAAEHSTSAIPISSRRASRRNEVMSFVKGGLQRSVDLAHQLQLGRAGAGRRQHVMYVWLDALTNYITARRLSRYRERRLTGASGRPICIWSARISCASMRSTGRPF